MNVNSAIFVPQVPPIAISGGTNNPFAVANVSPTNLGQWHFFANNNGNCSNNNIHNNIHGKNYNNSHSVNVGNNMQYYRHQQQQQQYQLRQPQQQQQLQQLLNYFNHSQQQKPQQHQQQQRIFVNPNYQYQWSNLATLQQQQQIQQQHHHKQKPTTKLQQPQQQYKYTKNCRNGNKNEDDTKSGKKVSNSSPTSLQLSAKFETEVPTKRDDTMQRNGSKASHNAKSQQKDSQQQHHQHNSNSKNDSSDSGISTNGHNAHHHHNHPHQQQSAAKARKSRSSSKRQDGGSNSNNACDQKKRTTGFSVNEWLGRDMVFYDRRFMSSCAEDNMMPRHNPSHRNSTSSEAAASDDLNSSSSNEDLSGGYTVTSKNNKKSTRSRQKRQQKRKQLQQTNQNNNSNNTNDEIPMEIDEETKENRRPASVNESHHQSTKSAGGGNNLRKQCTKAAALKAVSKHINTSEAANNNNSKSAAPHALTNSASNSSVCSTLSSSSSFSSSVTSSASSSPTNSAQSSPTASPTVTKRSAEHKKMTRAVTPPKGQHFKLNMPEHELVQRLRRHVIDKNLLRVYGYPVESAEHEGCIEILKMLVGQGPTTNVVQQQPKYTSYRSNNQTNVINTSDGLYINYSSVNSYTTHTNAAATNNSTLWRFSDNLSTDSGQNSESGDSSPISIDSDSSEVGDDESAATTGTTAFYTPDGSYQIFKERQCARCQRAFHVTDAGDYLSHESCTYHSGKVDNWSSNRRYSCCRRHENSEGCCYNALHVWTGSVVGTNGPYTDFVQTRPRYMDASGRRQQSNLPTKIYALDCEMSFTGRGLDVTKISVVDYEGQIVYEHYVRPDTEIIDYNSRFSGITEKDLNPSSGNSIKSLAEVHRDLLQLFDSETILIGHSLDNDLRALRLVHNTIVDTSIAYPHPKCYPYKKGLKSLTWEMLKREIQCGDEGHSCLEDAQASLELMLYKVHEEMQQEGV